MWSLPFLAGGAALFFWVTSGRYVETDNSYVKGDRVYIATELSGPIVEVAVACGFVSASHFSKCYRELYARSPQQERVDRKHLLAA